MSHVSEVSPAPRRIAAPRWLDVRLVLGVVLVLVSVLLGATVVSRAGDTEPAVTVRADLAAGTTLRAADLQLRQVRLPEGGRSRYPDSVADVVGKTLTRPVSRGELLPMAAVTRTPVRTTVTVSLVAGAAPELRAGQRIQLYLSTPTCAFVVLLSEVTVQSVRADDAGSFDAGTGAQRVVISVAPKLAPRIVAAQSIDDATVRAGVLSGTAQVSTPSPEPPAAATTGGLPSDLAACAGGGR